MDELIFSMLSQTLMITVFVLFMMVVIEYINVQSKNAWAVKMNKSPAMQIIIAALLGLTPGCMGAFTVVSLYTHRMMGLAGLVTVMIATSGDAAFVMFALIPGKALFLHFILLIIALATGWVVHLLNKSGPTTEPHGFIVHEHENCKCFSKAMIVPQLKAMSFERGVLLLFTLVFTVLLFSGTIGQPVWDWKKITFLIGSFFILFVFITAPEHFLKEHLFNHVLKKHLVRIFLWTLGALFALQLIQSNIAMNNLIQNNSYFILITAVLMGLIPESGPHLLFVTLYARQLLPFSILLANSIVQDGHGMLPLLAESRKDFLKVKVINMITGFIFGLILMQFGV